MKIKNALSRIVNVFNHGQDLALLFIRVILAYGFWKPAINKWEDINSVAEWFESLGIIAPKFNAYLAASTEITGVFLLIAGFAVRFISIPLMFIMCVAIATVHAGNGFEAGDNGYEIPLYYFLMLFLLLSFGGGKISVDYLIKRKTGL